MGGGPHPRPRVGSDRNRSTGRGGGLGKIMENKNRLEEMKGGKTDTELYVQLGIIAVLALINVFSFGKINGNSGAEDKPYPIILKFLNLYNFN